VDCIEKLRYPVYKITDTQPPQALLYTVNSNALNKLLLLLVYHSYRPDMKKKLWFAMVRSHSKFLTTVDVTLILLPFSECTGLKIHVKSNPHFRALHPPSL